MLNRFAQFARPYAPAYAGGFLLLLATNALGLWIPWLLRDAVGALEYARAAARYNPLAADPLITESQILQQFGRNREALSVLLTVRQKLEPLAGKIVISGINPALYRVFKITNLKTPKLPEFVFEKL